MNCGICLQENQFAPKDQASKSETSKYYDKDLCIPLLKFCGNCHKDMHAAPAENNSATQEINDDKFVCVSCLQQLLLDSNEQAPDEQNESNQQSVSLHNFDYLRNETSGKSAVEQLIVIYGRSSSIIENFSQSFLEALHNTVRKRHMSKELAKNKLRAYLSSNNPSLTRKIAWAKWLQDKFGIVFKCDSFSVADDAKWCNVDLAKHCVVRRESIKLVDSTNTDFADFCLSTECNDNEERALTGLRIKPHKGIVVNLASPTANVANNYQNDNLAQPRYERARQRSNQQSITAQKKTIRCPFCRQNCNVLHRNMHNLETQNYKNVNLTENSSDCDNKNKNRSWQQIVKDCSLFSVQLNKSPIVSLSKWLSEKCKDRNARILLQLHFTLPLFLLCLAYTSTLIRYKWTVFVLLNMWTAFSALYLKKFCSPFLPRSMYHQFLHMDKLYNQCRDGFHLIVTVKPPNIFALRLVDAVLDMLSSYRYCVLHVVELFFLGFTIMYQFLGNLKATKNQFAQLSQSPTNGDTHLRFHLNKQNVKHDERLCQLKQVRQLQENGQIVDSEEYQFANSKEQQKFVQHVTPKPNQSGKNLFMLESIVDQSVAPNRDSEVGQNKLSLLEWAMLTFIATLCQFQMQVMLQNINVATMLMFKKKIASGPRNSVVALNCAVLPLCVLLALCVQATALSASPSMFLCNILVYCLKTDLLICAIDIFFMLLLPDALNFSDIYNLQSLLPHEMAHKVLAKQWEPIKDNLHVRGILCQAPQSCFKTKN